VPLPTWDSFSNCVGAGCHSLNAAPRAALTIALETIARFQSIDRANSGRQTFAPRLNGLSRYTRDTACRLSGPRRGVIGQNGNRTSVVDFEQRDLLNLHRNGVQSNCWAIFIIFESDEYLL
jgi:hypothetical protein